MPNRKQFDTKAAILGCAGLAVLCFTVGPAAALGVWLLVVAHYVHGH